MSARAAARVVVATLLLTVIAGSAWIAWQRLHEPAHSNARYSPYIPLKRLVRMPGYKHSCRSAEDCPAPLSCLQDFRYQAVVCEASECESDMQCEGDEVCQAVPTEGPLVRLCLPRGTLEEGAICSFFPRKPENNCRPGLSCNFGHCGRPCRLDDPLSCPRGTFCREETGQTSCAPTCLETGCPSGLDCIPHRPWIPKQAPLSLCVKVIGRNCFKEPCQDGQECYTQYNESLMTAATWCITRCDATHPCANGETCYNGLCLRRCRLDVPTDCAPYETCGTFDFYGSHFCTREGE